MGVYATIADDLDCYCVDTITLGGRAVASQYTCLCGATHDFERRSRPLVPMPMRIGAGVWIRCPVDATSG